MSLKQWLAKIGQGLEDHGPVFGEMGRKGLEKVGLPGAGRALGEASVRHPRIAGAMGHLGIPAATTGAYIGAGVGADKLDALTANPDEELPDDLLEALKEYDISPKGIHDTGIHPAKGAVMGGGMGSLAHLLGRSPGGLKGLAKYMAIGAAGGGILGSGVRTYGRDEK